MKLHCLENKRGRNENLCFSDRNEQEFGGSAASRRVPGSKFEVPSSKLRACWNLEPGTWNPELGLAFSQVFQLVRRSPVASCLESSLPWRKPSRLAPIRQWRIGTPCASLTGP